jgi:hypothetical protein
MTLLIGIAGLVLLGFIFSRLHARKVAKPEIPKLFE